MIISFTGAQSTGKSTLLDSIVKANAGDDGIVFVPEVTRVLDREYGIPINEGASVMTQYQITCDHIKNAFKREPESVRLKVLDRCALDGAVYVDYFVAQKDAEDDEFTADHNGDVFLDWCNVADFARRHLPAMWDRYDVVFYTDPKDVPLVDDGQRSASVTFRDAIINRFEKYINATKFKDKVVVVSGTVEQRLKIIQDTLKERGCSIKI